VSGFLSRVRAVVVADLRIRFRRVSTLVIFLLLSGLAYVWVPDPATGKTLIQFGGRRALYNSAAIGMGTASLATIFIGLAGFYVVSNAIRRDVTSRCGFVIASTTMRGTEYLFGKFAGNVVFLATFMSGFMITSMAMLVVRGEAPLQPLVFMWQYALLVPPSIMFVSGVAILFESVPFLSGKFGDVAYFFLWAMTLGFVAAMIENGKNPGVAAYFDFTGFGFLLDTLRRTMHATQLSIGHSTFDPTKPLFVFPGLRLSRAWIFPRIFATLAPAALVIVARPFFHRFDPARVKQGAQKSGRNWMTRLGAIAKPFTRMVWRVVPRGGDSLAGAAWTDAMMTFTEAPLILVVAVAFAIAGVAAPPKAVMPIAFAAAAVVIADIACREKRAGTVGLVFTSPRLKSGFVRWKLMSSGVTALLVLFVPSMRLIAARPSAVIYVVAGIVFIVACATMLAVVSANPKTFLLLFLTFWYVVVNDGGHQPALDFAGWNGIATPAVLAGYLTLSIVAIVMAELFHRADLRRNF
jgi:hypothetical protein